MAEVKVKRTWRYICNKCNSVWEVTTELTRSQQLAKSPIIKCGFRYSRAGGAHLSVGSGCGYLNAVFDPTNPKDGI